MEWHRCRTTPGKLIQVNEIHVWRALLDAEPLQMESLLGVLSTDEVERVARFHFEKDQIKFIVARGILRQILGSYLGKRPHELRFEYTSFGKPVLANQHVDDNLHFNLSHAGEFALYAISRDRNIGIDIEQVRDVDVGPMVHRFFSPGEISSMEQCDEQHRTDIFFQYWTRKEAFLKAMGEGVSFPLEQCDVSCMSGNGWSPVKLLSDHKAGSRWYGKDLYPGPGYVAAIAVEGSGGEISCWDYTV